MKNITVSVDDEVYRRARIKAAETNTSVSALVSGFLRDLAAEPDPFDQLLTMERSLRERVSSFRAEDRLDRDSVHERGR